MSALLQRRTDPMVATAVEGLGRMGRRARSPGRAGASKLPMTQVQAEVQAEVCNQRARARTAGWGPLSAVSEVARVRALVRRSGAMDDPIMD